MDLGKDLMLEMYRSMQRIRQFESKVRDLAIASEIPGFVHVSIGEEASATGVCAALRKTDRITSTHRGHSHLIAKGGRLDRMMAELLRQARQATARARAARCISSISRSASLAPTESSAPACRSRPARRWPRKLSGRDDVTACFFGDGASNEGTFHESLNLAAVWKLPVVFVCENNGFGEFTPMETVTSVKDIAVRAQGYDIPGHIVDGNDVIEVYRYASEAIARARAGEGPTLLECKTYRWEGHVVGEQAFLGSAGYRTEAEVESWKKKCPLIKFEKFVLEGGKIGKAELDRIVSETQAELEAAVEFARKGTLPDPSEVTDDVYA